MKYVKKSLLSGVVAALLALLLLTRGAAQAATTSTCTWKFVSSPNGTGVSRLSGVAAVSGHDVWAVGTQSGKTLTEHWNGSQWSIVPSPNVGSMGSSLSAVTAISTKDVWAVGEYVVNVDGPIRTLIEHWNGSRWSVVPSPNNPSYLDEDFLQAVSATSANDVWAVGYYTGFSPDSDSFTLIEHWNGTQWSIVPSANIQFEQNFLTGVVAISPNNVWAVGYYGDPITPPLSFIEHWNGTQWSIVSNPQPNTDNAFEAISAVSVNDIWAVGRVNLPAGQAHNLSTIRNTNTAGTPALIEHWNGSSWKVVSSPALQNSTGLAGVAAVSTNNVWAVGSNGGPVLIEHWNGSAWKIAASPPVVGTADFLNAVARVTATSQVWAVGDHYTSTNKVQTLTAFHC